MIFRIRDSNSDLECIKFNGELVTDPKLLFNLKNRYDTIPFNINNWETVLVNLTNSKICYQYILCDS